MARSRWQTVSQIFEAALDRPAEERAQFVHEACRGDSEMELEVARLLEADDKAGSFLKSPALSTPSPGAMPDTPSPLLTVGAVAANRFRILRFIGQGGMGQVYEALDQELNSHIALKVIRPDIASDPRMLSRFRREVQLTRMITHPNVCRTFDIERHAPTSDEPDNGNAGSLVFLTMELLEGETLAAVLRREGRLSPGDALPLALQMIDALAAAHSVGVIHRDFKPSNVLLVRVSAGAITPEVQSLESRSWSSSPLQSTGTGAGIGAPRVVVTDFGLARSVADDRRTAGQTAAPSLTTSLTGDQALMGTLVYMAPEQFERGEASVATDVYSLGLVMFEMITGQRPFADEVPFAEAAKRLKQPAPSASSIALGINPAWDHAIARCLAIEPKDRFQNAQQITDALVDPAILGAGHMRPASRPVISIPESTVAAPIDIVTTARERRRRILLAAAIIVLVLSLSVVLLRNYWMKAEEAKLAEGSTVLLTKIQNGTGDKRFDDTTQLVRHQLLQSPYFSLLDSDRIQRTLSSMLKRADAPLDPQTAREVAMRSGVRRVVFGTVTRVGDSYVLDLDIEQPDNNPLRFRRHWENHWTWNNPSGSTGKDMPSGFLDAVRDSSDWIRHQIGESANDIAREDTPPEDVTTANWEALSEFAQAERFRAAGQADNAVKTLQNAVAEDPNFALAYARLGDILVSVSRFIEGYAAYDKALALGQQRLTRRERDRIRGIYANDTWDYATAEATFRDYATYYPNDYLGWFYRGTPLMMMGRTEEAIESLKKAAAIDPARMFAPAHIARFDLILGDYEDASKWIQHLRDSGQTDDAELVEGESDFLRGQFQQSQACFTKLTQSKSHLYRSYGYSLLTRLFAEQGKYGDALDSIEKGLREDIQSGDVVHQADKIIDRAYLNRGAKHYDSCRQDVRVAFALDPSLQRSLSAATLLGQAAYEAKSSAKFQITTELRSIEAGMSERNLEPLSNIVRAHVHGEVLLAEGDWQSALEEFRKANRLEPLATDKQYLGRALLTAAEHISNEEAAQKLRKEAFAEYAIVAKDPGLVWQWAIFYPPGFCGDVIRQSEQLH